MIRFTGLYTAKSMLRLSDRELRKQLNPETVSNRMHREDAVSWLGALACFTLKGEKAPQLIHGVDEGSAHYRQIFDLLDGVTTQIEPATTGRIVESSYRDRMPALRYPTCEAVISSP